jgi:hypothetical protein
LYEAVAQGLAAIRGNDWVAGGGPGIECGESVVADARIEQEVKLMEFRERDGASPRENQRPEQDRASLGMSTPRSNQPADSSFRGQDGRDTNRKR